MSIRMLKSLALILRLLPIFFSISATPTYNILHKKETKKIITINQPNKDTPPEKTVEKQPTANYHTYICIAILSCISGSLFTYLFIK